MRTAKCNQHNALIVVLNPKEEYIFSEDLKTTVIFTDPVTGPYLKRFFRGKCDENCPTVQTIFTKIEAEVDAVRSSGALG